MNIEKMIKMAMDVNKNSYAKYSNFCVSAVLMTKDKKFYTGVNVENVSYSMSMCAERTAFFSAITNGEREFEAIVIVGGKNGEITDYCSPCGACRQVMAEFCDENEFKIIVAKSEKEYKIYSLKELLPSKFDF